MSKEWKIALVGTAATLIAALIGLVPFLIASFNHSSSSNNSSTIQVTAPISQSTLLSSTSPTSRSSIPRLKQHYSGRVISQGDLIGGPTTLSITSEDQQGGIKAIFGGSVPCTGSVNSSEHIELYCTLSDGTPADISGSIYPDGHIEGTYTFTDGNGTHSGPVLLY